MTKTDQANEVAATAGDTASEEKRPATLCAATGQVAGELTRQAHALIAKLEKHCEQLGQLIYKSLRSKSSPMKAPAHAPKRGAATKAERLRNQKQSLLTQLGAEVARLQREQTADIMSQPSIQEISQKIQEIEEAMRSLSKKRKTS